MMKKNILLIIAILLILSPYSFSYGIEGEHRIKMDYKASVGSVDPNGKTIKVNVNGMVCDFCARALEKVFMKEKSVSGLTVDLKAKEIKIYTKKNMNLEDNIIEKKIKDSGYIVSSIERL